MFKTLTRSNSTILSKVLSLPMVLTSPKPKEEVINGLVKLLKVRLKNLSIIWNSESFRKGISNPELPKDLLNKLDGLISLAEASNWKFSPSTKFELDETVEEIETFNPSFRKALGREVKRAEEGWKKGRFITGEEIKRKLGVK